MVLNLSISLCSSGFISLLLFDYDKSQCLLYKIPPISTQRRAALTLFRRSQPLVSDESEAMLLDPKFAVLDSLGAEEFELEVQAGLAKLRWNKMKEDGEGETGDIRG